MKNINSKLLSNNKLYRAVVIILYSVIVLFGIYLYFYYANNKLYDQLDAARDAYRESLPSEQMYTNKDGDYVESVSVHLKREDTNLSSIWDNKNTNVVYIRMDNNFDRLPMRTRCQKCVAIMDEMNDSLYAYFKDSEYYKIFEAHKRSDSMQYRGILLYVYFGSEYTFVTDDYTYYFPRYTYMTVTPKPYGSNDYYEYHTNLDGVLTSFENRYKSSKKSSTTDSSAGQKTKNRKKNNDLYDSYKYKSAQDFAGDKYEEFYDYEDDYDDEDEAYDAAEDYWYDY